MLLDEVPVLTGHAVATSAGQAVQDFHQAVARPDTALVVFFSSAKYDAPALVAEMKRLFGDAPVVGCSTSGEIGPAGCSDGAIAGVSFAASHFSAASCCIGALQDFDAAAGRAAVQEVLQALEAKAPGANADNTFAFLMIDGLSMREEPVTRSLQAALGRIPLVGGSAGDGLAFGSTWVYSEGQMRTDSAVLVLVSTLLPFKPLMTHHFVAAEQRLVVTAADPARRIVHEIDGLPAAQAYGQLIGVDVGQLDPAHFAASPMAVVIGGMSYVRSIRKALPDGSLAFFCAIEEGMVMRVTHGTDLVANLEDSFARLRAEIGPPLLVLGGDCILRRLEIEQKGLTSRVAELMVRNRVCAFNTYGEQYRGVHVNQTFAGIAIGSPRVQADG